MTPFEYITYVENLPEIERYWVKNEWKEGKKHLVLTNSGIKKAFKELNEFLNKKRMEQKFDSDLEDMLNE